MDLHNIPSSNISGVCVCYERKLKRTSTLFEVLLMVGCLYVQKWLWHPTDNDGNDYKEFTTDHKKIKGNS